jgi:hypothetical protein
MLWLSKVAMRSSKRLRAGFAAYLILSAFIGPRLFAAPKTPSAADVLDRYVQATGGAGLWRSQKWESDEIEGRALDDNRVVLKATISTSRSGNSLSEVSVPQVASEGVYRGTAWAVSRFSGVRVKAGVERDEALRESRMMEESDWRSVYPKAQVTGAEEIAGHLCFRVLLGADTTEWFDESTSLLVRRESSEISSEGRTSAGFTVEQWTAYPVPGGTLHVPSQKLAWRGDFQYRLNVLRTVFNGPVSLRYPTEVADYLTASHAGKALPNAEAIIERHIYESGGPDAYGSLKTQQIIGSLTFLSTSAEAHVETWAADGGKYYQSIDVPGLGKQEEGSDGRVAWERSPALGPRVKTRKGPAGLSVTLDAAQVIGWRYVIDQVRTEAFERVDDHDCYRVRLVPRDGSQAIIRWYDRKSGLLYRSSAALASTMGALPVIMTFEEYRDTGGLKWPVRTRMVFSGQSLLFTTAEVKLNEPVENGVFELPEEIRQLADRKDAGSL